MCGITIGIMKATDATPIDRAFVAIPVAVPKFAGAFESDAVSDSTRDDSDGAEVVVPQVSAPGFEGARLWQARSTLLCVGDLSCADDVPGLSEKYNIHKAANSRQALHFLESAGGTADLVVTDLSMPFMDGISLCRTIREELKISAETMPVIMIDNEVRPPATLEMIQSMSEAAGANGVVNALDKASMFEAYISKAERSPRGATH